MRGPDLPGPVVCNVAGLLAVAVSWMATSAQPAFGPQLPYANLGAAGVLLAGAGNVVYLVGARRLLRRRMRRLAAGTGRAGLRRPGRERRP